MTLPENAHYLSAQLCCRACQSFALRCPDCGARHSWDWRHDPESAATLLRGGLMALTAVRCHCGVQLFVAISPGTRLSPDACRLERTYRQPSSRGFAGHGKRKRKPAPPPDPLQAPCPPDADRRRLMEWAAAGVGGAGVSGGAVAAAYRRLFQLEPPRDPMARSFRVYSRRELTLCMAAAGYEASDKQGVQP